MEEGIKRVEINFNPRTREGCDFWLIWVCPIVQVFQSTHPRGVRPVNNITKTFIFIFQSTHPRGVRPGIYRIKLLLINFNPRTREGCDFNILNIIFHSYNISIHAPARGATEVLIQKIWYLLIFQSTHPRGVRQIHNNKEEIQNLFQSTHPRGVRR